LAGKDEMRKVENWETRIRIDQGIFNHEGRKMTRKGGAEKMKLWKVENRNRTFVFNPDRIRAVRG
jgi:hypothetical protein